MFTKRIEAESKKIAKSFHAKPALSMPAIIKTPVSRNSRGETQSNSISHNSSRRMIEIERLPTTQMPANQSFSNLDNLMFTKMRTQTGYTIPTVNMEFNVQDFVTNMEIIASIVHAFNIEKQYPCDEMGRYWLNRVNSHIEYIDKLSTTREKVFVLRNASMLELKTMAAFHIVMEDLTVFDKKNANKKGTVLLEPNFDTGVLKIMLNYLKASINCRNEFLLRRISGTHTDNKWVQALKKCVDEENFVKVSKPDPITQLKALCVIMEDLLRKIISTSYFSKEKGNRAVFDSSKKQPLLDLLSLNHEDIHPSDYKGEMRSCLSKIGVLMPLKRKGSIALKLLEGDAEGEVSISEPYLPLLDPERLYTLVLDLDETLVHYHEDGMREEIRIRPHAHEFLKEVSKYYEVVVFTAGIKEYADWIIDQVDTDHHIQYRLYRHHTIPEGPVYVKDLSKLGRDLSKVIMIDNNPQNFRLQPDNGIFIKTWMEDEADQGLLELQTVLVDIVQKKVKDVRRALKMLRDQIVLRVCKGYNPSSLFSQQRMLYSWCLINHAIWIINSSFLVQELDEFSSLM
eukprot:TRINITY_DN94_c0_g2_i2.p1 TRINITY_DN94_c0_g2~~TRINITY_DN94_c0_g2_i2.p1  ORF type:complete len:569 (+),score=25.14 TRINITY_DN94_c0_g2_i2:139-1845(+)